MSTITINTDTRKALEQELERMRLAIIGNMRTADKMVTGGMADSMRVEIPDDKHGALTAGPYFATLETGSKPWRRKYKHPPRFFREIIGKWIADRGLALSSYLVARTIMREGSTLYREGGRKNIYTPEIPIFSSRLMRKLSGFYSAEITASIMQIQQTISDK